MPGDIAIAGDLARMLGRRVGAPRSHIEQLGQKMVGTMTRILLVEDHAIVRSGIRALLESSGMEVVGEAADGLEAVRLANEMSPDLILMDVAMPRVNGIEAAREILSVHPESRIIMLSMHSDEEYVFEAMRAGVAGSVL